MECIFCFKPLRYKNTVSYFAYIAFCEDCPFRFYDYDNNIYFQTNIYEFSYYGFNKAKIYEPQTVIIKKEYKIIFSHLLKLKKEDWVSYFNNINELNSKLESIITYI